MASLAGTVLKSVWEIYTNYAQSLTPQRLQRRLSGGGRSFSASITKVEIG